MRESVRSVAWNPTLLFTLFGAGVLAMAASGRIDDAVRALVEALGGDSDVVSKNPSLPPVKWKCLCQSCDCENYITSETGVCWACRNDFHSAS